MYIICGLGNPGLKYEKTRHNVGFRVVDELARRQDIKVKRLKFKSLLGEGRIGDEKVLLAKPQTYMNNSGEAIRAIMDFYKEDPEKLIVILDDIDIPLGKVRIRKKGSSGSHNGLKSVIGLLGRDDFPRIRLSIGKKPERMDLADFVLSNFSDEEEEILDREVDKAADACQIILDQGIDMAMNRINPLNLAEGA